MNPKKMQTILIANRGEIAVRVSITARKLGYRSVAIYSDADRNAPHVRAADDAVYIGASPVGESYLNMDAVLAAAAQSGADAIHPGYGFLSENSDFVARCQKAGLIFIGPPAPAMNLMGNKRAAKIAVMKHKVPVVPGYQGQDQSDKVLLAEGKKIGYPLMVKASAGGGGRGMRLVHKQTDLKDALRAARAEALSAFGNDELILEKAIIRPRHVEIQIFADSHGNAVHLGERDCSVQRRHQKVLEESPSPAVTTKIREAMGSAAVNAAKACGYEGAGTVEFLLAEDGSFYFLEMNTRLQVEHPVTEMVTGLDLVEWQLLVAAGEPLPLSQEDISFDGHAIEARLYAEDPAQNFMPQTGTIHLWQPPSGEGIRVDSGVETGGEVTPHYDPMIAKIIVHGSDRAAACRKLASALASTRLFGLEANTAFLHRVCTHPDFVDGKATTAFIEESLGNDPVLAPQVFTDKDWALAAFVLYCARSLDNDIQLLGWSSATPLPGLLKLAHGDDERWVSITRTGSDASGQHYDVALPPVGVVPEEDSTIPCFSFSLLVRTAGTVKLVCEQQSMTVDFLQQDSLLFLAHGSQSWTIIDRTVEPPQTEDEAGSGHLLAPLDGAVMNVFVEPGQKVAKGDLVLVLEAMKMEHQIKADVDGEVTVIHVKTGDQMHTRDLLIDITPDETPDTE